MFNEDEFELNGLDFGEINHLIISGIQNKNTIYFLDNGKIYTEGSGLKNILSFDGQKVIYTIKTENLNGDTYEIAYNLIASLKDLFITKITTILKTSHLEKEDIDILAAYNMDNLNIYPIQIIADILTELTCYN